MDKELGMERSFLELLKTADLSTSIESSNDLSQIRIHSLSADSRTVRAGSCFVAIPGGRYDGRRFIASAVGRGAVAVVSEAWPQVPQGVVSIRVTDARSALSRLAAAYYGFAPGQRHSGMKLIGVTGTNGKSTTCVLLKSILERAGRRTALMGTIFYELVGERVEARWTTPPPMELYACLARAAERGATHAVVEVSSHSLAQSRCVGHRFACAVFTNLSGDHLDYHGSVQAYGDAKKRLFDGLDADAWAIVNQDDPAAEHMVASCGGRILRFGLEGGAEVTADITSVGIAGCRFVLRTPVGSIPVGLALTGRHNVSNALAAAAAAFVLGYDIETIGAGLESVPLVPGRLQRVETGERGFALFVDYAHTDDALVNVLAALRPLTPKRLICVFGCGGDRDRSKRPRMARAAGDGADRVIVTSDNPRGEDPIAIIEEIRSGFTSGERREVEIEPDRRCAIERAVAMAERGDTVLIAGKGHENYQIIGETRRHFDDVEVAMESLGAGREGRP